MSERKFHPINLSEYFNNDGISYDDLKCDGAFDGHGATYPAEELPESNSLITIDGVSFYFPSKENGDKNNFTLREQVFTFPAGRYSKLFLLGASEGSHGESFKQEAIIRSISGNLRSIEIGLSNWLLYPTFNERLAFACSHLHHPDQGQTINRNISKESSFVDYEFNPIKGVYESRLQSKEEWEGSPKGDWKPKLWLQQVALPDAEDLTEISFEEENLNFHVFCMTFEMKSDDVTSL